MFCVYTMITRQLWTEIAWVQKSSSYISFFWLSLYQYKKDNCSIWSFDFLKALFLITSLQVLQVNKEKLFINNVHLFPSLWCIHSENWNKKYSLLYWCVDDHCSRINPYIYTSLEIFLFIIFLKVKPDALGCGTVVFHKLGLFLNKLTDLNRCIDISYWSFKFKQMCWYLILIL